MKKSIIMLLGIAALSLHGNAAFSTTVRSLSSGNWSEGTTWSANRAPHCGDSVIIHTDHVVKLNVPFDMSTCGNAMHIQITGALHMQPGKNMKLPAGSIIAINKGGMLTTETAAVNQSTLAIGNSNVWQSVKGTLTGPATLQLQTAPVTLVHFSAKPGTDGIILSWVTSSELNNAGFIIEKSKDGVTFSEMGKIKGGGTSSVMSTYKYIDKNPVTGLQYYRLSQKDLSGSTTIMNPITIRWNHNPDFNVYPNPSKGELYANVASSLNKYVGLLMITNQNGSVVVSRDISFREKTKAVTLVKSSERLTPGSYLVNIICNGSLYTQDVMVQ